MQKKIFAIPGSTRQQSSNHSLIRAIARQYSTVLDVHLFEGLTSLPHFNPDYNFEQVPETVAAFRQQLSEADGILICTPEYGHGVPGSLKNAIDWTISTGEFSQKPTVLITASTDGKAAHQSLLETLWVIEAGHVETLQLLIPVIRAKMGDNDTITDEATRIAVQELIDRFVTVLNATVA